MAGALPLLIRTKGPCISELMAHVYPDKNVRAYSDQRSMRLPSPAQRAGFRVGIITQRANGPAICPMVQTSGPLALWVLMGGR